LLRRPFYLRYLVLFLHVLSAEAKAGIATITITKIDGKAPSDFEGKIYSEESRHSPSIDIEASIKPVEKGVKVYWSLIDPDDQTSARSPVDWNDNDRIDSDGLNGDIDGNDNRGVARLSFNASTTDNNGIAKVTLIGTPHGGDNFIVRASLKEIPINSLETTDKIYLSSSTKVITVWMRRTVEVDEMEGTSTAASTLNDYLKDAFYTFEIFPPTPVTGEQDRQYVEPDVLNADEDSNGNRILDPNEDDGGKLPPSRRLTPVDDGDKNLENFFIFPPELLIMENAMYAGRTIKKFLQNLDDNTGQIHLVGCHLAHPWFDGQPIVWFGVYVVYNAAYGMTPPGSNDIAIFYDITKGDNTTAHEVSSHIFGSTHSGPPAEPKHRRTSGHSRAGACLAAGGGPVDTLCDNCLDFLRDNPY
jgi:hypothetical protein